MVDAKELSAMVLTEVRCGASVGHDDIAVLLFKPAASAASR